MTAGTVGALTLFTGTALAHECYIATKTTKGPQSDNWSHITVADAAVMFGDLEVECPEQLDAAEASLRAAGLPLSIKVFSRFTLAESAPGRVLADGKGLEHFGAGSTLADSTLTAFITAALAADCPA